MTRSSVVVDTPKEFTLDKFFLIVDNYKHIESTDTPLLIIKYGPPGSGKTSADSIIHTLFGVDLNNFAKVDKDTPLVAIKAFRTGSLEILNKFSGLRIRDQRIQKKVVDFQDTILKTKNKNGLSIVDKIPIVLQRAFDYNHNILWETTGQSKSSQDFLDLVFETTPKMYKIIVLFPIVSLQTQKQRVLSRAEGHLNEEPPYFRPVPVKQVKQARINSYDYFLNSIIPRVLNGGIDQLLCYSNENKKTRKTSHKRIAPGWRFKTRNTRQ